MIDYQRFCQIKHLAQAQGLNASQIARELALDPRTVSYWLAQDHFHPRKPGRRRSKLDPFKAEIVRMLEKYPYSAAQVMQRITAQGFDGGYSIVKDYVRTVRPRRTVGQAPVLNPKYLDFANHMGFTIVPCGVGKGNEKGRVENAVGYVKKNFLAGLDIPDFSALAPAARHWLDTVANVRVHGETR